MQLHWCIKLFQNICFINFPAYSIVRCLSSAQIKPACFSVKCDKTWEAYACRTHRCNWSTYGIAFLLIFFCCGFFPYSSLFVFFSFYIMFCFSNIYSFFLYLCALLFAFHYLNNFSRLLLGFLKKQFTQSCQVCVPVPLW